MPKNGSTGRPSGAARASVRYVLLDSLNPNDLRNLFLEDPLDAVGKGQLGHRASTAGALELDLDHAILGDLNERHIPAVGLKGRANLLEGLFYSLPHAELPSHLVPGRSAGVYVTGF